MTYSLLQVAEVFVRTGELADALDILNQQLDLQPDDDIARRLRAAVLLRLALDGDDHFLAALEDLDALANPTGDDWVQRSIILQRLEDFPGALQSMAQAHTLKPDDDRVTARVLDLLLLNNKRAEARTLLDSLPAQWRWLERAGDLAAEDGDHAAAVNQYTAALDHLSSQMDTDSSGIGANLKVGLLAKRAASNLASDLLDEAEADYVLLETLMPTDAAFPFFCGLILARRGDIAGAVDMCRAALERAGDSLRTELLAALNDARYAELRQRLFG